MKDAAEASMETPDISLASSTGAVTNETLDAIPSGADADGANPWSIDRDSPNPPQPKQTESSQETIGFRRECSMRNQS
ncbi:hypothetical protein PABG_06194 [Paracoccidioides brasiliensis Pb03]|nr:hypothetical protein PABG_06194 [Paracoccidioides brasiliensis Pb03]